MQSCLGSIGCLLYRCCYRKSGSTRLKQLTRIILTLGGLIAFIQTYGTTYMIDMKPEGRNRWYLTRRRTLDHYNRCLNVIHITFLVRFSATTAVAQRFWALSGVDSVRHCIQLLALQKRRETRSCKLGKGHSSLDPLHRATFRNHLFDTAECTFQLQEFPRQENRLKIENKARK